MSGSTKDYNFGQKNNWRRTFWNEILKRTAGREKTETILYLPGPEDLDRVVAVSKGVPDSNLVGIDFSIENVRNVRANSNYAICADAIQVLRSWPETYPVCAIVLDFCHGLVSPARINELSDLAMFHGPLTGAILAVNLMRGRDSASNVATQEAANIVQWLRGNPNSFAHYIDPRHRGFAFSLWHAARNSSTQLDSCDPTPVMENLERMNPKFLSYRSGPLVFDSLVASPLSGSWACVDPVQLQSVLRQQYPKDQGVVRKIAATLATRTRQMGVSR